MIRFSAALVAVAIGVLIGGIATSELLLVYIAIVVSAVALVILAIGIVLKREELFGAGLGLVPAGAGASPMVPVRTGASHDQVLPNAHVVPPPLSQGAAGVNAVRLRGDCPGSVVGGRGPVRGPPGRRRAGTISGLGAAVGDHGGARTMVVSGPRHTPGADARRARAG